MRSYLVGNQTLDRPLLAAAIAERAMEGPATFHVVVPAAPSKGGLTQFHPAFRAPEGPRRT